MTRFTVTVRYGAPGYRYDTFEVEAPDVSAALEVAAERIGPEVRATGDLVEIRSAPVPDERAFLGE